MPSFNSIFQTTSQRQSESSSSDCRLRLKRVPSGASCQTFSFRPLREISINFASSGSRNGWLVESSKTTGKFEGNLVSLRLSLSIVKSIPKGCRCHRDNGHTNFSPRFVTKDLQFLHTVLSAGGLDYGHE